MSMVRSFLFMRAACLGGGSRTRADSGEARVRLARFEPRSGGLSKILLLTDEPTEDRSGAPTAGHSRRLHLKALTVPQDVGVTVRILVSRPDRIASRDAS